MAGKILVRALAVAATFLSLVAPSLATSSLRTSKTTKSLRSLTGTSKRSTTPSCTKTTTVISCTTITPSASTTTVTATYSVSYLGDDGIPLPTTTPYTVTISDVSYTSANGTRTVTITTVPTVHTTEDATSTVPPPSGFLPVQSSYPGALFVDDGSGGFNPIEGPAARKLIKRAPKVSTSSNCKTVTATSTSTELASAPAVSTVTTTTTDCEVLYLAASTTVPCSAYTTPTYVYTTITTTSPTYSTTSTVYANQTYTYTAPYSTTTVFAACATNNYANFIGIDAVKDVTGNRDYAAHYNADIVQEGVTAYSCCVSSFAIGCAVWRFSPSAQDCYCWYSIEGGGHETCPPQNETQYGVLLGGGLGSTQYIIGNTGCGEYTPSGKYDGVIG